jgi:signal transduction histidine kinase
MRVAIFIKIFLGFWLVSVAILGSWLLTSQYIESLPPGEKQHRPPHGPPERFVLGLIYGLQNTPAENLPSVIEEARNEHNVKVWLLDRENRDLLDQHVPTKVANLATELRGRKRRAFSRDRDGPMVAHRVYLDEHGPRRMVLMFPKPAHKVIGFLIANHWLRVLLAILVSGLICYGLSRLVTNRLRELGQASRQLAQGKLQTRINVRDRGGDETDELARDFNTMASQLEERMQAQKQLLSDVSHELRSPLARMRVALALAMEAPEKQPEHLERLERETSRLEELIGQLLSSQQAQLQMDKHIDLIALLAQLCEDANFEGDSAAKSVKMQSNLEEAVVATSGDLLHKSFDNIIRNALRHTDNGTQVVVSVSSTADTYQIQIRDHGPGVDEVELTRIFDEFYRVDSARTREQGGYGLGLAIAQRAIAQHGGSLSAENTGSGLQVNATLAKGD